jgi:DNA-binding NarL/FixJ family response regulator
MRTLHLDEHRRKFTAASREHAIGVHRMLPNRAEAEAPVALIVGGPRGDRDELAQLLEAECAIEVISCANAREALSAVTPLVRIAVVALDVVGLGAGELIAAIRRRAPDAEVIALARPDHNGTILKAMKAGAVAYLVSDDIARRVVSHVSRSFGGEGTRPREISPRECQVLRLLSRGESYIEIGAELGISLGTVQTYIKALYRKLEVRNKAEAAVVAVRRGIA